MSAGCQRLRSGDLALVHDGPPQSAHRSKPPHVGIVVGMSTPPRTSPRTPLRLNEHLVHHKVSSGVDLFDTLPDRILTDAKMWAYENIGQHINELRSGDLALLDEEEDEEVVLVLDVGTAHDFLADRREIQWLGGDDTSDRTERLAKVLAEDGERWIRLCRLRIIAAGV